MIDLQQPLVQALPPSQHHFPPIMLQHLRTNFFSPLQLVLVFCTHVLTSLHLHEALALQKVLKACDKQHGPCKCK